LADLREWGHLRGKKLTVLLDSWCWIEYFNGTNLGKKVANYIDSDQTLFISVINLAEVYKQGLIKKNRKDAEEMVNLMMSRCFLLAIEADTALNAAQLSFERKWGLGDSLIYATAKSHKLQLVSGDHHFKNEKDVVFVGT